MRRQRTYYWTTVLLAMALTTPWTLTRSPLRSSVQNLMFDEFERWRPRVAGESAVRILAIDDESIAKFGRWPWSRARLATLVDRIAAAKPAVIAFDLLLSETEDATADAALAHALEGRPVVLGEFLTDTALANDPLEKAGFVSAGDDPTLFLPSFKGALTPLPDFVRVSAGVGFLNWIPDADRIVRRVPLTSVVKGRLAPSLAMEALRVAQGASTYLIKSSNASGESGFGAKTGVVALKNGDATIPTDPSGEIRIYHAPRSTLQTTPAWKAMADGADLSGFEGAIVFVGVSAAFLSDIVGTPLSAATPGVEEHAQIVDQILHGAHLQRPDWANGAEFFVALALSLLLTVALPRLSALGSAAIGAGVAALLALGSWWAFAYQGLLIDPILPSASSGVVFLVGVLSLYGGKRGEERAMRSAFGRYVSPAVVARLARNPGALKLGGEERHLTVMFCDIRAFTTLSEGMNAAQLTHFLNEYLTPLTDAILESSGTIDKYMGDAIMAFWNAPLDDPLHARHAAATALQMRVELERLNRGWLERNEGFAPVKFGVGLNSGECCVGNLGSTHRFDYSVIGDEVNIASRLEGSSKAFGVDIVASQSTRDDAPEYAWLEIDEVLLKNKTRPVAVFALAGDPAYASGAAFAQLAGAHEALLSLYRAGRFEDALRSAEHLLDEAPEMLKGLYAYYCRRFRTLAETAPAPEWRPMVTLDEK